MTSTRRSPTLRRRRLSRRLRSLREDAELTAAEVTKRCGWATGTLTKWERGDWQRPGLSNMRTLAALYDATDAERAELEMLAQEGRESGGWWHAYRSDLDPAYSEYIGLEYGAEELLLFEALVIHGLFQTDDYARAIIEAGPHELDQKQMDLLADVRRERQKLLTHPDDPLRLCAVLDEAALHRQVGGPDVMRAQLRHLLEMAQLDLVTIQVTPYTAGAHPGVNGPFAILSFPEPQDPPAVYFDSPAGQLCIDDREKVRRYEIALQRMQAMALPPAESLRMIDDLSR